MVRFLGLATIVAVTGCSLYFDDGEATPDGGTCGPIDGGGAPLELRNPDTLQCTSFGGGGTCDPGCAPCPLANDQAPAPPWAVCNTRCETLGEFECTIDDQCRAAYDWACYTGGGECSALIPFIGCFALSQSFSSGVCEGLDSWSCSSRNDCIALHQPVCDPSGLCWPQFVECRTENR